MGHSEQSAHPKSLVYLLLVHLLTFALPIRAGMIAIPELFWMTLSLLVPPSCHGTSQVYTPSLPIKVIGLLDHLDAFL
jgi:hypothetical protein